MVSRFGPHREAGQRSVPRCPQKYATIPRRRYPNLRFPAQLETLHFFEFRFVGDYVAENVRKECLIHTQTSVRYGCGSPCRAERIGTPFKILNVIQNFGLGVFFSESRNRIRPTADRYSPPTCRPPLTNRIPRSTACRAVSGTGCLVVGRGRWRCSADVIPMLHDHLQGSVSDSRLYGTDHEPCHCSTPVRSRKPFSPHGLVGPTSH